MALLLLGAAAYGAYVASQRGHEEEELEISLEGKTSIRLLPLEQTLGLFDTPMTTLTYFDGNYLVAAKHLMERIPQIIEANPWLGGWGARAKGDTEVKLWYDETGKEVASGIFYCFEPGEVPFTTDVPYDQLEKLGKGLNIERKVKIPSTPEVLGKNQALWRVTVVPTTDKPDSKFALVVSMSRLLGDMYTFYMLQGMLSRDMQVFRLNPVRHLGFDESLIERVGREEAGYIEKVTSKPTWEWTKTQPDPTEKLLFLIDDKWLEGHRGEVPDEEEESEHGSATSAIVASWFFKTMKPKVGLVTFNFRNILSGSRMVALNAGNYSNALLFTEVDYATPELIREAEKTFKRCGTDPPAPLPGSDLTFSAEIDWASELWECIDLGEGVSQTLHLPWFDNKGLSIIPNKLSALFLFTAKPGEDGGCHGRKLGALVVAPQSGVATIIGSGAVGEVIAKF